MTMHSLLWLEEFARVATGTLVTAMGQGAALALVAWLGLRLLPKTPAGVRFAVWFGVFGVAVALPVVDFLRPTGGAGNGSPLLTLGMGWSLGIAAVWAVASMVRAATLVVAAVRLRELWKTATPVEGLSLGQTKGRMAQVCVSDRVDRPSVIGFFSPKILLPEWLLERLTPEELQQIVLHEASHLGRADDWLNLLQKIALVVFPLNPALVWIERRLCFERELACDERVLGQTQAPKAYASCLATLAEYRMGRLSGALSLGALGRESELGQRIGRILAHSQRMSPLRSRLVLVGAMVVLVAGAAEMSRCPELVAFSGGEMRVAEGAGVAQDGYRYQSVVFHPEPQASAHFGAANPVVQSHRSAARGGLASRVQRPLGRRQPTLRDTTAKDGPPEEVGGTTEWVVLTAWDGAHGTRLVLTRDSDAQTMSAEHVHPYAAVPVRGGWLVFQM